MQEAVCRYHCLSFYEQELSLTVARNKE